MYLGLEAAVEKGVEPMVGAWNQCSNTVDISNAIYETCIQLSQAQMFILI